MRTCLLAVLASLLPTLSLGAGVSDGAPGATELAERARAYELYLEAGSLSAEGENQEARQRLEEVLRLDPGANVVRARLARVCLADGDTVCAENEARRALEISRDEIEARKVLAEILLQRFQAERNPEQLEEGLSHLEQCTRIDPQDPWAWAVRVRVLGIEGRIEEAEAVAATAASTPGLDPAAPWMALARVLLGRGRQQEAVDLLERVKVDGQAAAPLLELLAELKAGQQDLEGQARALAKLRQLRPEDATVARKLGMVLAELGDFYGAVEPLRSAFAIRADDTVIRRDLAGVLVRLGRGEEAIKLLSGLPEVYRTPHAYMLWARAAEQIRDFGLAASRLEMLVERLGPKEQRSFGPSLRHRAARDWLRAGRADRTLELAADFDESPETWRLRLAAYEELSRRSEGLSRLEAAIAATPDDLGLISVWIDERVAVEGPEAALSEARRLLKGRAGADRAYASVSSALAAWGHADLGARLLQGEPGDDLGLLRAQAGVYFAARRFEEAEARYRRILELAPEDDAALNDFGYLLAIRGGSLDEALRMCRRAVELRPDQPAYMDSLGWVLHLSGRSEEALHLLRSAALSASDASLAEIHEHLGDVYAALGRRARAIAEWQAARSYAEGGQRQLEEKIRALEDTGSGP